MMVTVRPFLWTSVFLCLRLQLFVQGQKLVETHEVGLVEDDTAWTLYRDRYGAYRLERASELDINEFLEGVIENFKEDMITGVPELKIPILDPFQPKKALKVDVEEPKASVHGNFTNVYVKGLSGFALEHLDANLVNLTLKFGLKVPFIRATGNYSLNGKIVRIVPIRGKGGFWVESKNLSLSASATIIKNDSNFLSLADDIDVDIDFDTVKMDLENFLGGGRWTEVLKNILNNISKSIFKKVLPLLKGELNKALLKVINKKLSKKSINIGGSTANEYVDEMLVNVERFIQEKNYDPMELPEYHSNFSKEVMFITFHGESRLYDGWLKGISSLHRTDECSIESNKTTIAISAHLGLNDLTLNYKGHAKFMSFGPSIECGGKVKKVSFYFAVEQSNKRGSKPVLRDFEIVEMSTIWIELSGLGPLTWLMKYLLTGISKLVEGFIVDKVTENLRCFVEQEFQKVSFPV